MLVIVMALMVRLPQSSPVRPALNSVPHASRALSRVHYQGAFEPIRPASYTPAVPESQPQPSLNVAPSVEGITIVHYSDFHGHYGAFDEYGCDGDKYGGIARLIPFIKAQNGLVLHSGDEFTGTTLFAHYNYTLSMYLNGLVDVMTLGNHEFDLNTKALKGFLEQFNGTVISGNVHLNLPKYKLVERQGKTIAILGSTTEDALYKSRVGSVMITDGIQGIKDTLALLPEVDYTILLSHHGYMYDQKIANEVEGIDVILGGHSHTLLHNGPSEDRVTDKYPIQVRNTYIAHAGCWGRHVGVLHLTEDGIFGNTYQMDGYEDQKIKAWVQSHHEKMQSTHRHVGTTTYPWLKEGCRVGSCDIGTMISTVMQLYGGADLGIMNERGIRANLRMGDITSGDLKALLPFENKIAVVSLTGVELYAMIHRGFVGRGFGYPIPTTLQFSENVYVKAKNGQLNPERRKYGQLVDVQVNGAPLRANRIYKVAMTCYMADGGDHILPKMPFDVSDKPVEYYVEDYLLKEGFREYRQTIEWQ